MSRSAPPVRPSAVQNTETGVVKWQQTYGEVQDVLRANSAAQTKAILAMLGGDSRLMDRFLATTFKMLAQQKDTLQRATPASIIDAIMTAASMGLEPMTEDGAIVVYGSTAQFQPMWRGYLKRIRNSGKVSEIDCQVVYENDDFEMGLGTDPYIRHVPARTVKEADGSIAVDRGGYMGVYAWALMPSGKTIVEWMEEAEVNYVRDTFSQAKRPESPWNTSWGEMARKTVIRRLAKRLPASAVDALLTADRAVDEAERQAPDLSTQAEARRQQVDAALGLLPTVATPAEAPPAAEPEPEPQPEAEPKEEAAPAKGGLFNE